MTRFRYSGLREIQGLLRLSPIMLAAVMVVLMLWQARSAATSGLFQSSPIETPTGLPATPTVGFPGIVSPTVPILLETPTLALPTDTATPEATSTPPPPTDTPVAPPAGGPNVEPTGSQPERYPAENTGLKFDWSKLFDSTALLLSGIWLCCGVLLFLAIPAAFAVLWVVSKRRQEREG